MRDCSSTWIRYLLAIANTVRKPWSDTGLLATPLQVPENFSSIFSPDAIL
jgi:hypothetical protein